MYYIIVNPASKSGRGARIWSRLEPVLIQKEITYKVFLSKKVGHIIKIVRDLDTSLLQSESSVPLKLIILGGDGTLNETLQGISDFSKVQIGYIPTGSSNDMARDLKLPGDPVKILENILSCEQPVSFDLGCLQYNPIASQSFPLNETETDPSKRYFSVSSGIGFDAAVCEEAMSSRFKNILNKLGLGKLTYMAIALKQIIAARKITCDICLDDHDNIHLPKFLFVAGMIHQYEGGGFKFCPGADSHDGIINICVVGNISKLIIFAALPTAFWGRHYMFKGIDAYKARKVRITTSSPLWVHTDGEVSMRSDSITLTCENEKLLLLI